MLAFAPPTATGDNLLARDIHGNDLYSAVKSRRRTGVGIGNASSSIVASSSIESSSDTFNAPILKPNPAAKRNISTNKETAKKEQPAKKPSKSIAKKRSRPLKKTPVEVSPSQRAGADPPIASSNNAKPISQSEDIDEILAESDELLRAAYEAQALGRLAAAQTYLYLSHARLIGLGQRLEQPDASCADPVALNDSSAYGNTDTVAGTSADESLSLPVSTLESPTESKDVNVDSAPQAHNENISDRLAHSAKELLHKHARKGMQYDAHVEKKKRIAEKGAANNAKHRTKQTKEKKDSNVKQSKPNHAAHGETTSKMMMGGPNELAVQSVIPRTVLNCAYLNAQSLLDGGMMEAMKYEEKADSTCCESI